MWNFDDDLHLRLIRLFCGSMHFYYFECCRSTWNYKFEERWIGWEDMIQQFSWSSWHWKEVKICELGYEQNVNVDIGLSACNLDLKPSINFGWCLVAKSYIFLLDFGVPN